MLTITDLDVYYGTAHVISDLHLTVEENEVISIIGPNGAGKTTLFDTITGHHREFQGTVELKGTDVTKQSPDTLVTKGLAYCSEERNLFGSLTVSQNLMLGSYNRSSGVEESLEEVLELFPKLDERASQEARTLSGGEQQMLAIGRALMSDPDLLLLDEPTLGLAPIIIKDLNDAISRLSESGMTIVIAEQNVTFGLRHADEVLVLENGEMADRRSADDARNREYIQESYLGGA